MLYFSLLSEIIDDIGLYQGSTIYQHLVEVGRADLHLFEEAVEEKKKKMKEPRSTWSIALQEDKKDILDEESEPEG